MLAALWALLSSPLTLIAFLRELFATIRMLRDIFNPAKSPVDEMEKDRKAIEDGQKKAEGSDDTSNTFG